MLIILLYIVLGYWSTGVTIYANSIMIGTSEGIFIKRCTMGAILGWALIPIALIKIFISR